MSKREFYRLADRLTLEDKEALGLPLYERTPASTLWNGPTKDGEHVMAKRTSAFRIPQKGEWYLSGASPAAYRAPNTLLTKYRIMKLVIVEQKTKIVLKEK